MSKKEQAAMSFETLSDEEIAAAMVIESKIKTLEQMNTDLKNYLSKMGKDSTFKGWIAHVYPENVEIDERLKNPNSNWRTVWNSEISRSKTIMFKFANIFAGLKNKKLQRSNKKSRSSRKKSRKKRKQLSGRLYKKKSKKNRNKIVNLS